MKKRNVVRNVMLGGALLFAGSLKAQTLMPVVNPSFEQGASVSGGAGTGGPYSFQTPVGWTKTGAGGLWQPDTTTCGYRSVPDGATVAWTQGGTLSQDLGVPAAPSSIYTFTVFVGHRGCQGTNNYTVTLKAGTTQVCAQTGNNAAIPQNTFLKVVVTCTTSATPSGDVSVSLESDGVEVEFDDVSLTVVATVAPVQNPVTALISATYDDGSVPTILTVNVNDVTDPKNTIGQLSLTPDPITGLASGGFTLTSTKQYQVALIMAGAQVGETFYDGGLVLTLMPKISQANFSIVLFKNDGTVKSFESKAQ